MLFVQVILFISIVTAQDDFGGGEDAGADMDLESMMGGDSGGMDDKNPSLLKNVVEKSFLEESTLALQQLGVIIGEHFCSKKHSLYLTLSDENRVQTINQRINNKGNPASNSLTSSKYVEGRNKNLLNPN